MVSGSSAGVLGSQGCGFRNHAYREHGRARPIGVLGSQGCGFRNHAYRERGGAAGRAGASRRLAVAAVWTLLALAAAACGADAGSTGASTTNASSTASTPPATTTAPASSTTSPPPGHEVGSVVLGEPFLVEVGESVTVEGAGLTVTYVALLSDSRCPIDVQCITAGNATVSLSVDLDGAGAGAATVELNTTEGPTSAIYGPYLIELVDLERGPSPAARLRVS